MARRKREYVNINDRYWGSLESRDKAQREQNAKAWAKVNRNLPPNAFANDDPEADDDVHKKYYPQPTMVLGHAGSSED
jgi:hypothetical protein|tara:strand:- start:920 stop:1153 length:234 start_codon:yes stop_codon:yes gene_type:complete